MPTFDKEKLLKLVQENEIGFIRLQFTDILGSLKNIAIPAKQLEKALNNQIMFDGSSIEGFVRIEESDMYLRPDLSTFAVLPLQSERAKVARLICDVYTTEGVPFEGDPRNVLKRALARAEKLGYACQVGPELEFFLFLTDKDGKPLVQTQDDAGYFDLGPVDLGESARCDMCLALEELGFEIEASHHEAAHGQHEIDFKYGSALRIADDIMTFKLVVKSVAMRHGLHATFMPKPIFGIAGSGMHVNISLTKDGKNAFYDENDPMQLSMEAYHFIAGLLEHARGTALITNPLVNSYKRLVPGYEAPVYIAWSAHNRSPLIRIPSARKAGTRVEVRNPDPSANPYLALAVLINAGLDGIERELMPPASTDSNIYDMSEDERKAAGIENLPAGLDEAIAAYKQDPLLRQCLGHHVFYRYLDAKVAEWDDYRVQIHPWEIDHYLSKN